jgi:hypothetical protein
MDVAMRAVFDTLAAQRAWIGVRRVNYGAMEYVQGQHVSGAAAELPTVGEKLKPRVLDRGQNLLIPQVSLDEPFSVMSGPLPLAAQHARGAARCHFPADRQDPGRDVGG